MSKNIIEGYLRETIGYKGVIVSDDMTMGGITKNYNLDEYDNAGFNFEVTDEFIAEEDSNGE